MTSAEKMRAARERAEAAGLCTICCQRPPPPGYRTCEECRAEAAARVTRSRKAAKKKRKRKRGS